MNIDHCISVYPFMGPIYNIALEGHLLHALTETGLESYTVRIGHKLCRSLESMDNINSVRYFANIYFKLAIISFEISHHYSLMFLF